MKGSTGWLRTGDNTMVFYNNYWLLYSWGTDWGMKGFAKMTRGMYNQCGIATHATFPSV